jgi:hypothetical protein
MVNTVNTVKNTVSQELTQLEGDVRTKIFNFEKAGLALEVIREKKLYRQRKFLSFHRYAKKFFDLEKEYIDDLILGARICAELRGSMSDDKLPKNLSQAIILGGVRTVEDRVAALKLAWEQTLRQPEPVLTVATIKECVNEVKRSGREHASIAHLESNSTDRYLIPTDPERARQTPQAGTRTELSPGPRRPVESLPPVSPRPSVNVTSRSDACKEQQSDNQRTNEANSHPADISREQDGAVARSGESRRQHRLRPRFGESIPGTGMLSASAGYRPGRDSGLTAASVGRTKDESNHELGSPMPVVTVDQGTVVLKLNPYTSVLSYRGGLNARLACQSIAYLAALEIGRQAGCGCDQTLITFGDEIALQLERAWEEWTLLADELDPEFDPLSGTDLRIHCEAYGKARIRLSRKGSTFRATVTDVDVWNTFRAEHDNWPVQMERTSDHRTESHSGNRVPARRVTGSVRAHVPA